MRCQNLFLIDQLLRHDAHGFGRIDASARIVALGSENLHKIPTSRIVAVGRGVKMVINTTKCLQPVSG